MMSLADASLAPDEQALLERFVVELEQQLKDEMHAVWLFGSRAGREALAELRRGCAWEQRLKPSLAKLAAARARIG